MEVRPRDLGPFVDELRGAGAEYDAAARATAACA
jgi:fatty acid omega-hydroxylase